ncbi:MAG: phospho-N-acetylmuramoyl-pentapeptide-transferase [Acidimicrobiaceae bacterium]|nr:phospho-N-acetylmuramoyl-pentapeptide-transferase [Acidimicrobiaceae bacterium]
MIAILLSSIVAVVVAGGLTPPLIRRLAQRGIGQQIREDGPKRHIVKAGTPTMGGIALVIAVIVGYAVAHAHLGVNVSVEGLLVLGVIVMTGLVGFIDDYSKIKNRRNLGLTKSVKLAGQFAVALAFAVGVRLFTHHSTAITLVRISALHIQLGSIGWVIFAVLVVVGSSNAVNLTDGLDGLATGSSIFAFGVLGLLGYWQFRHPSVYGVSHSLDLALIAASMTGALTAFLWYNAPPAGIFMGDTGSLAIGAGLGALCLMMNLDLLLPILGGLFVIETISVIAQVFSFRVFHRRVLKMAPIHHHFELLGWPETTVLIRFWILAGIFTALGVGIFYADFISLGTVLK